MVSASLNFPERLKVFHFKLMRHLREVLEFNGREQRGQDCKMLHSSCHQTLGTVEWVHWEFPLCTWKDEFLRTETKALCQHR
jgi:hypothetical protein